MSEPTSPRATPLLIWGVLAAAPLLTGVLLLTASPRPVLAATDTSPTAPAAASDHSDDQPKVDEDYFLERVKPILEASCVRCHHDEGAKGGFNLAVRETLLAGGGSGRVVDLNDPASSLLLKVIRWEEPDLHMPPKRQLPADRIDVLTKWVMAGVPWPEGVMTEAPPRRRR